MYKTISLF
jgi:hypothetical protein